LYGQKVNCIFELVVVVKSKPFFPVEVLKGKENIQNLVQIESL